MSFALILLYSLVDQSIEESVDCFAFGFCVCLYDVPLPLWHSELYLVVVVFCVGRNGPLLCF